MNNQKILIVDDEPINIKMLGNLFKHSYKIQALTNGCEVMDTILRGDLPDLILLDVVMPNCDGYNICRLLKENEMTKNIPVIFITSKNSDDDQIIGLKLGAADYISKPFHPEIVIARVRNQLELKRYRDILENAVYVDGLTKVANRRKFDEYLDEAIATATRTHDHVGLIMIDIDFFKKFNDTYGHMHGDIVLEQVADAIQNAFSRKGDLVARYGGEEFSCIVKNASKEGVKTIIENIQQNILALEIPHVESQCSEYVTVSMGAFMDIPKSSTDSKHYIDTADKALYQAKSSGRNRYVISDN